MYNWCLDYGMIITLQIWDSVSLSHQRSSCILCSSHLWSWKKSWLLSSSGVINEGKNHPQLLWSKIFQHLHIWDFNFDLVFHGFLSSDCIHFSKCSHSKISSLHLSKWWLPKCMLQGHRSVAYPFVCCQRLIASEIPSCYTIGTESWA